MRTCHARTAAQLKDAPQTTATHHTNTHPNTHAPSKGTHRGQVLLDVFLPDELLDALLGLGVKRICRRELVLELGRLLLALARVVQRAQLGLCAGAGAGAGRQWAGASRAVWCVSAGSAGPPAAATGHIPTKTRKRTCSVAMSSLRMAPPRLGLADVICSSMPGMDLIS
jgi:hypothetical protein